MAFSSLLSDKFTQLLDTMLNFEQILHDRRESVTKTIRPISMADATTLGESLFPHLDDPWREQFFGFLAEHPEADLYHADLPDGAQLLYCRSHHRGIWFIPGEGKGIIQETGLNILAEIVAAER